MKEKQTGGIPRGKADTRPFTKAQSLDLVQTAHRETICPLIICRMRYTGALDIRRLTRAVQQSRSAVPEIAYEYEEKRGGFIDAGWTAEDIVLTDGAEFWEYTIQHFSKTTQLKILVGEGQLVVAASHILCDGAGFLQYLYLLASLYNGAATAPLPRNRRDIGRMLAGVRVKPATAREKRGRAAPAPLLHSDDFGEERFCLTAQLDKADMAALAGKAKDKGATLNSVFLAAYARVLTRQLGISTITLPCPADLRRFAPNEGLTVANMTGMYKITAEVKPHDCFDDTLAQVQEEMRLQKEGRRCFARMGLLQCIHNKLPPRAVNAVVQRCYRISPISYTNIGVVDSEKLAFKGISINKCFITGAYRNSTHFQLAVSTFDNICTLACALTGGEKRRAQAQELLALVKQELQSWEPAQR